MQMRAVAADQARIERRDYGMAVRRQPALASIARHQRMESHVLNDDVLEALETRSRRRIGLHDDGSVDLQLVQIAAAPPPRALALPLFSPNPGSIRRLLHPRGLLRRTRRQLLVARQFVLDRLMLDPQLRERPAQLVVLRLKLRKRAAQFPVFQLEVSKCAEQITHRANQVRVRKPLKRIREVGPIGRHSRQESHF